MKKTASILLIVVFCSLWSCKKTLQHNVENENLQLEQSTEQIEQDKEKDSSTNWQDSLKQIYPEPVMDRLFARKDSIFRHVLLKKEVSENIYKGTAAKGDYIGDYLKDIIYYKYTGKEPINDSLAFWIYLDKYENYKYEYSWAFYLKQKNTTIRIGKQKFQYISYFDFIHDNNRGILAYPTILKPIGLDEVIFFNFDTLYTDNKYLYTRQKYPHGDDALYSTFKYKNGKFYLVSEKSALDTDMARPAGF